MAGTMNIVMPRNIVKMVAMTNMLAGMIIKVRCVVVRRSAIIGVGRRVVAGTYAGPTISVTDSTIAAADSNADSAPMATVTAIATMTAISTTGSAVLCAGDRRHGNGSCNCTDCDC